LNYFKMLRRDVLWKLLPQRYWYMLRYNLFTYRDLWLWLDNPFEVPAMIPGDEQLMLAFR